MSKVTINDLDAVCRYLTRLYLPDSQQFSVEHRASGFWFCLRDFNDSGSLKDISPKGVTKTELHYYIRMFESGLEFNKLWLA